jgi:gliding motility-associated-like protein
VSYFTSIADLEADVNAIATPSAFSNTSNPQTVYIKTFDTVANCFNAVPLTLEVNLPPAINFETQYDVCFNPDNLADLSAFNNILLIETTGVMVSYYTSLADATNQTNALPDTFNYTADTTNLFARVAFTTTGCFYIQPFTLVVNPLPVANAPSDLEACDDSSEDGVALFDLSVQDTAILGGQDAALFSVSYYANANDAAAATNALPVNFNGANGQTIYARVENIATGCFSVTQFNVIVNEFPNTPDALVLCDDDYDGLTTFDLTQVEPGLLDTPNPNIVVSYFTSIADLEADVNAIATPSAFDNTSNPQTVYIKTFNTVANCFNAVPLTLEVNLPPAINFETQYDVCFNPDNLADLSAFNNILLIETTDVTVSYYASLADATNQTNALPDTFNYTSDTTNLFARVAFTTTGCFYFQPFTLVVNPLPEANTPGDLEACDDDFDGLQVFDLSVQTAAVLGTQSPTGFTVTYHNALEDAEAGINALGNNYQAIDMETIYVRVEDNLLGCFNTTSFSILVHPRPVVNIPDQVFCPQTGPLIVSADTGNPDDSYLWFNGSTGATVAISEPGTYSVLVTSIFGCETEVSFGVTESESPVIESVEVTSFSDPNRITVNVSGSGDYYYFLDGEGPQTSNVFENVSPGFHTVTVIDLNGCEEATQEVVVIDAPKFMTPNNDGYFDTWHIAGVTTLPGTRVSIFDRYGKLLAVLDAESPGWDGTYRGSPMPSNDYWFVAEVVEGERSYQVRGHFTLKR